VELVVCWLPSAAGQHWPRQRPSQLPSPRRRPGQSATKGQVACTTACAVMEPGALVGSVAVPTPAPLAGLGTAAGAAAVSVPLVLAPNPAAGLVALRVVAPSPPAAGLAVVGTWPACPPLGRSTRVWYSKPLGPTYGYRPIAARSRGSAIRDAVHPTIDPPMWLTVGHRPMPTSGASSGPCTNPAALSGRPLLTRLAVRRSGATGRPRPARPGRGPDHEGDTSWPPPIIPSR
jgi:hypothetical protein